MAKKDNPVLGAVVCDGCGGEATVHQSSRGKGRFLYTRCPECGCDQRNGKAIQTRLWTKTEWRADANPNRPPNVAEDAENVGSQSKSEAVQESESEPAISGMETEQKPAQNRGKAGPLAFLGLVAVGLVALAG